MDYVHIGDRNGVKGVYDINLIDDVTQFQHLGAAAGIAETFLIPVPEEMLVTLPFVVLGFHADNHASSEPPVRSTGIGLRYASSCSLTP